MPGVCPGGGGMLKLRFDRYIIVVREGKKVEGEREKDNLIKNFYDVNRS